jgi:heat shock protein HtpX
MLANFAMFFQPRDGNGGSNPIAGILIMILAPIAAMIVQMAISRSREYEADRMGAEIAGDADSLARALDKIERYARGELNIDAERNPATAHMFIINPLAGRGADNLFSTHPATRNRIEALLKLSASMGGPRRGGPWSDGGAPPRGGGGTSVPMV